MRPTIHLPIRSWLAAAVMTAFVPATSTLQGCGLAPGDSASSSKQAATACSAYQGAYGGTPWTVPGTIQAENYDLCGQQWAYYDTTAGNTGGAYRHDDVDIEGTTDTGGGYDVGWIAAGEWLNYSSDVTTSGAYQVQLRVAATSSGQTMHFQVDGVDVGGAIIVPNTGGWQKWTTVTSASFDMTAGSHVLALSFDTGNYNVNWFDVRPASSGTGSGSGSGSGGGAGGGSGSGAASNGAGSTACRSVSSSTCSTYRGSCAGAAWAVPGQIEAENYDLCGEESGYYDTTPGNTGGAYRSDDVDIEATTDTGGGYDVAYIASGEWLNYSSRVATTGSYQVQVRVATTESGQALHLAADGVDVTGSLAVPNTGGWQTWTTITSPPFTLTAGNHVLALGFDTGNYNVNWIDIQPASGAGSGTGSGGGSGASSGTTDYAPYFPTWTWYGGSSYAYQNLVGLQKASGLDEVTIAFVLSNGGCDTTQDIEDNLSDVDAFIANGGHVKASFGGADGTYVESKCATAQTWAQAIESFVDATGITDLDFDIEQSPVMTDAVNQMRGQALARVQQSRNVKVSLTIAAGDPSSGLDSTNLSVVMGCVDAGVVVSHVNLMTMDYGNSNSPVAPVAISSLNAVHAQLMQHISGLSSSAAWAMLGVTPMIGRNDDTEVFSLADAQQLASFVEANHVGLLAFWSIDRDQVCPSGADYNGCSTVNTSNFQFNSILQAVTK